MLRLRMLPGRTAVAAVTLAFGLLIVWPAVAAAHPKPDVVPIVECVSDRSDGTRVARLGWDNRTGRVVTVHYGHDNNVTPGSRTHDLPRRFTPGRTPPTGAFPITFSSHEVLVWRLFGRAASSAGAPSCSRPTTTTEPPPSATTSAPQPATTRTPRAAAAPRQRPAVAAATAAQPPPPTTAAAAPSRSAAGALPTEPVAIVLVDALPSLAVGLLVLVTTATTAMLRRRPPR